MTHYSSWKTKTNFLICLAVLSAELGISFNRAIATSAKKEQYCHQPASIPNEGYLYSLNINSRINLRSRPDVRSNIEHVVSGGPLVIVRKRVMSNDGYCWFWVRLRESNVKGWVRGDLLDMGDRD